MDVFILDVLWFGINLIVIFIKRYTTLFIVNASLDTFKAKGISWRVTVLGLFKVHSWLYRNSTIVGLVPNYFLERVMPHFMPHPNPFYVYSIPE